MNAFKRKSLYTAVVAGLGALGASQAGAVNLSTDGTGQVLLYPYYTVRGGMITSITVVNTNTSRTKVAKVRFLEGKNSAEVLDFNLWLSPRDVWTGSVIDNGTGGAIYSVDNSCTAPGVNAKATPAVTAAAPVPFVNYYYAGQVASTAYDNGGLGLDRTREGYVEIIEMANVADTLGFGAASTANGNLYAAAVKHNSAGVPANCATVQVTTLFAAPDMQPPTGGLMGEYIIISSSTGTEFASNPVALQNFQGPGAQLYSRPGDLAPDLTFVAPDRSDVIRVTGAGSPVVTTVASWTAATGAAIDAVSAILMRSSIMNEFDVSTNFKTDLVVTQPTKRFYVRGAGTAAAYASDPVAAVGPYANTFASATADAAKSCDTIYPQAYDREEAPYTTQAGVGFSPQPQGQGPGYGQLCWESTVMTVVPGTAGAALLTSQVFKSVNSATLTLPSSGSSSNYATGWAALWPTAGASTSATGNHPGQFVSGGGASPLVVTNMANGGLRDLTVGGLRYRGLPAIGFAATQAILGGQGYGGIFDNKYSINIQ
jgi:hypothetical protein